MTYLAAPRLFTGRVGELLVDQVVEFDDGRITGIHPLAALPSGVEPIDLGDVSVLPGLIDTHQHLCFDGNGTLEEQVVGRTDAELQERAYVNARRALRAGITTIRDLGDRNFVTLELRAHPDLPTILAAGPPLTADGGHCWYLGGGCRDRAALVEAVHERHRRGCDVVKIMVTGGALTPTFPMWASQFTAEEVAAVVTTAHALGLPVAAHCHGIEGTAFAVDAGVDTIEHCTFFTREQRSQADEALIERIAAAAIPVSATLGRDPASTPPPVIAANLPAISAGLRSLRDKGATVVVGTDAGISASKPHDILPYAALELAEIGVTGSELLATLTSTAAEVCGVGHRKGRLAPGYDADILAVGGDPLTAPDALQDVRAVWRGGRRYAPSPDRTV